MQEPEGKHGGDRQPIWSIPKSEQATSSASSSLADLFRRTGVSRLPRDPGAENGAKRNGHHRPHGRYRRRRRGIVAGDRRGRETGHGGSKIHRGKVPEPPQGNADKAPGRGHEKDPRRGPPTRLGRGHERRLAAEANGEPFDEPTPATLRNRDRWQAAPGQDDAPTCGAEATSKTGAPLWVWGSPDAIHCEPN